VSESLQGSDEIRLTVAERWILANQYRLMQVLSVENVDFYNLAIEILENGYTDHYSFVAQYLVRPEFPTEVAAEVRTILRMFQEMQWAAENLDPGDAIVNNPHFEFDGFDGNNHYQHLFYAGFLYRLEEFPEIGNRLRYNSHRSTSLDTYRRMVQAWESLPRKGLRMTHEDLQMILEAAGGGAVRGADGASSQSAGPSSTHGSDDVRAP
jgi:uncharacterized protein YfbU (UPF0304 family)